MSNWRDRVKQSKARIERAESITRFYECGICDHLHPWDWDGDCRDDLNRFTGDEIPDDAQVSTWDDRLNTDPRT
jgi:hypothetical protein